MWTLKKNYSREEDMKCLIWRGKEDTKELECQAAET